MAISIQRLTLFAIFDALEKDLRSLLLTELLPYHNLNTLLNENELSKVSDRYKKYGDSQTTDLEDVEGLIQYLDLLDSVQILNRNKEKLPPPLAKYFSRVTTTLEKCAPVRNTVMHGRPLEIDDFPTICGTASKFARDTNYNWSNISDTLSEIENNPSYVFGLNFAIIDESPSGAFHNLPTPEFDDTGFVGRKNILAKVEGAISGPFPVISLVGPGGVGKTALALKVTHQLLANENLEFEAIVWVSAKANTLTAKEIERIEGAIEDSIGVFRSIVAEFDPNPLVDPEDVVIDLLTTFRILLIIDNLETVLDERLRRFIQKVPKGSKILLTSRIGVGAGDLSIEVPRLTMAESRVYFRKLVESYSVQRLGKIKDETLERYIRRLIYNPLFLKWFVTAVKAGTMPERLLANQTEILRFCLENVVEHLSANAKRVCNAYLVVAGPHSLPMLGRLTELEAVEIETALSSLITCNIVAMISVNDVGDTAYQMADLPRAYLRRISRLSPDAAAKISQRYRRVQQTLEHAGHYQGEEVFRFENFQIQNRDQAIVVSELKKVLSLIRRKDFENADELLVSVNSLAPGYFEVERVKAYLKFETGDFVAAREAYEMALELNSNYAPLFYWYGGFLLRAFNDLDGAFEEFEKALALGPSAIVKREQARVLLYKGMFEQAGKTIDELLAEESTSNRHIAILTDLKIQCYCRAFEHQIEAGEVQRAVELLVEARRHGEDIPLNVYDERMAEKYRRVLPRIEALSMRLEGSRQEGLVRELAGWAKEFSEKGVRRGRIGRVNPEVDGSRVCVSEVRTEEVPRQYVEDSECTGFIARVSNDGTFGFIGTAEGDEFFFHQSAVISRNHCVFMAPGVQVDFLIGRNAKGFCGKEVRLKFNRNLDELMEGGEASKAYVVFRREGTEFGVAIIPDHGELLIRKEGFSRLDDWAMLKEGDQVHLVVQRNEKGFFGNKIIGA